MIKYGIQAPAPIARDLPTCSRRSCCHPGRQFGGDEACRIPMCGCHMPRRAS